MPRNSSSAGGAKYGRLGDSIFRVEDLRLLTGHGCYTDDLAPSGCSYLAFVRSPHAHARIREIDTTAALKLPDVAVMTGADLEAAGVNSAVREPQYPYLSCRPRGRARDGADRRCTQKTWADHGGRKKPADRSGLLAARYALDAARYAIAILVWVALRRISNFRATALCDLSSIRTLHPTPPHSKWRMRYEWRRPVAVLDRLRLAGC
jgi:CO/xanthine dehydrogenase Mo-binding subunit